MVRRKGRNAGEHSAKRVRLHGFTTMVTSEFGTETDGKEHHDGSVKWHFLEHCGPVFPPSYKQLPQNVCFYYDNEKISLSQPSEEVASFYGKMYGRLFKPKHGPTEEDQNDIFKTNFFEDWQKVMTEEEREKISDLKKCDFSEIVDHFKQLFQQIRKDGWVARKKGKLKEKEPEQETAGQNNEHLAAKHGFCIIDGEKVEIPSYRIYSPGIFHSRQEDLSHALGFPWIKDQIIP